MIQVAGPIENHFAEAGLDGAFRQGLANGIRQDNLAVCRCAIFTIKLCVATIDFSRLDAAAIVWPRSSLMIWA